MISPPYLSLRARLAMLEASGCQSLHFLQCRILLVFYELGHGIFPAVSVSVAACARACRAISTGWQFSDATSQNPDDEEKRRTWWAIHNLERYIALCCGDAPLISRDAREDYLLPAKEGYRPQTLCPNIYTGACANMSAYELEPFARECQVAHLVGRIVQHVFDPISDVNFRDNESVQLERTLVAFLPVLVAEELKDYVYCGARSMCLSALLVLYVNRYNHALAERVVDDGALQRIASNMEAISNHLHKIARPEKNQLLMSPMYPYTLFQAIAVQRHWCNGDAASEYLQRSEHLIEALKYLDRRWQISALT
ncbi:hypothetical protein NQ176_g3431 [Zarea fungicola]|uniref:Uncharacterized protein n=1 Tax=Zarea fungicola TaxID=93591 RepID=A0ACC1NJ90_9HYPO|nr:hypothetical protein NQ176_g3431 [Lecanicillium fungicola]